MVALAVLFSRFGSIIERALIAPPVELQKCQSCSSKSGDGALLYKMKQYCIFLRLFSHPKTFWKFDSTQIVENEFQSTPTSRALETSYNRHIVLLTRRK